MEIRNFDAYSPLHKSGHTSKGDQLKWKIDDRWYKADYMGYEGLSEVLVSDLLQDVYKRQALLWYMRHSIRMARKSIWWGWM